MTIGQDHSAIVRRTPASNQSMLTWVEPWYLSFAMLGASVAGMVPVFLPLVVSINAGIAQVGFVMAAFNLGGVLAPLWGNFADRRGLHRAVLGAGLLITALALALFPFASSLVERLMLALLQGAGAATAATVANLFVVEVHPEQEWERRIAWLQTYYGSGQMIGLLLAGYLSRFGSSVGLFAAAAFTLLAIVPGLLFTPTPSTVHRTRPVVRQSARPADWSAGSPQMFYHHLHFDSLERLWRSVWSPFGIFLAAWFLSFAGSAALFSLYPLVMENAYGVDPSVSSVGFAVSAGLGLLFYVMAGTLSRRIGAGRVLNAALLARLVAFAGMFVLGIDHKTTAGVPALLCFLVVVLAWSLLSVTGTALTARFSHANEGEGLGLFNAVTGVGGVLGALAGGWVVSIWGYNAVAVMGMLGVGAGLILSVNLKSE